MVLVVIFLRGEIMAYFLKQATLKGRTYLSIVESFYHRDKKGTAHRTHKSLGSIETHKANGIEDPVTVFQPVFVQKESTIKGHFLICYLTI